MNWIINGNSRFEYHTHLNLILQPIMDDIDGFNWLISDLTFMILNVGNETLPINHENPYFILSSGEFDKVLKTDIQIIWGVIIGIPNENKINLDETEIPYADGNSQVWEENYFQNENAEIEITCFDSSVTIIKFRNKYLSDKFKAFFTEAISLKQYNTQSKNN